MNVSRELARFLSSASRFLAFALAAALLLASAACNYIKPVMYIDVANRSGRTVQNLEVRHPSPNAPSQFGLPQLKDEQTHRHMTPTGTPCQFTVEFDDQSGKHFKNSFDLGAKCPAEVAFEIGAGMSVSERVVRP